MLGYLSADIICSHKQTMNCEELSKDKYPSTFSCQMEAIIAFTGMIRQIFFATHRVLKIGGASLGYCSALAGAY